MEDLKLMTDGKPHDTTVDGYPVTVVSIAATNLARAVGLVFAGCGDGPEVAQKLVTAFNHHTEIADALRFALSVLVESKTPRDIVEHAIIDARTALTNAGLL